MSREYLYKAKRINWRELPKEEWWVEGNLVWSNKADKEYTAIIIPKEDSGMFLRPDNDDLGFENWYLIEPETVCEYTGLTNKSSKKIFENDLIGHKLNQVEFLNGEWCINGDRPLFFFRDMEIVGNYFDKGDGEE